MKEIARPLLLVICCATFLLFFGLHQSWLQRQAAQDMREAIQQQCTTVRSYLVHEGRVRVLLGCPDGTQYWQWKDHE